MGSIDSSRKYRGIVFGHRVAALFFLVFILFGLPSVTLAQAAPENGKTCAEDRAQVKCNQLCWQKEQCQKEGGEGGGIWQQNDDSIKACGPENVGWAFCYPHDREITLQIPIGEAKEVSDIGKYIKIVYLFVLGIAGLVGVIMFIHAGLLWLTSGGNSGTISEAKERVRNVAIGMILLFGSYTILSAINPDLVRLRVPRAHLIRNIALEFEKKTQGKLFEECNVADPRSMAACKDAGGECIEQNDNAIVFAAKVVSAAAVLVVGSAVISGTAIASVGAKALSVTAKSGRALFSKLLSFCTKSIELGALCALGTAGTVDNLAEKFTKVGICIKPARNLEKGEICAFNGNCKSGVCLGGNEQEVLEKIGVCSDGTEGSPCETVEDCHAMPEPAAQRVCADGVNGSKWCATTRSRGKGSPCHATEIVNGELASECGPGLGCQIQEGDFFTLSTKAGIGWCVDARIAAGGGPEFIGDSCAGDCPGETEKSKFSFEDKGYRLICNDNTNPANPRDLRCTSVCNIDDECTAACPAGQACNCSAGLCVLGARVVEVIHNGTGGCNNPVRYVCAEELTCVGPVTNNDFVCTDGAEGSKCVKTEDCKNGAACDIAGGVGTGVCRLHPVVGMCANDAECVGWNGELNGVQALCTANPVAGLNARVCTFGQLNNYCSVPDDCSFGQCGFDKCTQ